MEMHVNLHIIKLSNCIIQVDIRVNSAKNIQIIFLNVNMVNFAHLHIKILKS